MKAFLSFLVAAMLCASPAIAQSPHKNVPETLLGVGLHKKISFQYNPVNRSAKMIGLGGAQLENSNISTDTKIAVTFTVPKAPGFDDCVQAFKQDMVPQTQIEIWGPGHSAVSQQAGQQTVNVTMGKLVHCDVTAGLTDIPIMPPTFLDGSTGVGLEMVPPEPVLVNDTTAIDDVPAPSHADVTHESWQDDVATASFLVVFASLLIIAREFMPPHWKEVLRRAGRWTLRRWLPVAGAVTAIAFFAVAVPWLVANGRASYYCGLNPDSFAGTNAKYCAEDVFKINDPNEPDGCGDIDHPYCFK